MPVVVHPVLVQDARVRGAVQDARRHVNGLCFKVPRHDMPVVGLIDETVGCQKQVAAHADVLPRRTHPHWQKITLVVFRRRRDDASGVADPDEPNLLGKLVHYVHHIGRQVAAAQRHANGVPKVRRRQSGGPKVEAEFRHVCVAPVARLPCCFATTVLAAPWCVNRIVASHFATCTQSNTRPGNNHHS